MIEFGYIACLLAGVCFGIAGTLFYQIWINTADDWGDSQSKIEAEHPWDDYCCDDLPPYLRKDYDPFSSRGSDRF